MKNERRFYAEVGKRIRTARQARSMTQEALATLVSLTRTSITNIEKGRQKFPLHTLAELAAALHVPPSALLPGNCDPDDAALDLALEGRPVEEQAWIRSALGS